MWYSKEEKKTLDYSKPIVAMNLDRGHKYLLLPQIQEGSYDIIGYNWFDIKNGNYNSMILFKTVSEAVDSYRDKYYITNVQINLEEI